MTKGGMLSIGTNYAKRFLKLERLTKKKDVQVMREIVDNILYDAERLGLTEVPTQRIGIKPLD